MSSPQTQAAPPKVPQAAQEFWEMAEKYHWAKEVTEWMLAETGLNARGLEDFEYAVASESAVTTLVDAMGITLGKLQQVSWVRQAWVGLKKSRSEKEAIKKRGLDEQTWMVC